MRIYIYQLKQPYLREISVNKPFMPPVVFGMFLTKKAKYLLDRYFFHYIH